MKNAYVMTIRHAKNIGWISLEKSHQKQKSQITTAYESVKTSIYWQIVLLANPRKIALCQ